MLPVEKWSREKITAQLSLLGVLGLIDELIIEERVASTNDVVAGLMRSRACSSVVCLAEEQTMGRGRRGRSWISPTGGNFYGSIGWEINTSISAFEGLSLAIGVVLVRLLRRKGVESAQLKWPNDILVNGAKLGGVLIESVGEPGGRSHLIVGIGLNLYFSRDISDEAGIQVIDLVSLLGRPISRNEFGAQIICEVIELLRAYSARGFSFFEKEWNDYDALNDVHVTVSGLNAELQGVAAGVNEHGALKIKTASGIKLITGGEVSLRKQN